MTGAGEKQMGDNKYGLNSKYNLWFSTKIAVIKNYAKQLIRGRENTDC